MSSRAVGSLALAISLLFVAAGTAATTGGCSNDTKLTPSDDGGIEDATSDANRSKPPESDASLKSCRQECEEANPTGLPKDEAINSCWETHCGGPCIEQTPGDAGADAAAPEAGTCSSPVVTVSESCDRCSSTFCCAEWDACFQDPACTALNACYQACDD